MKLTDYCPRAAPFDSYLTGRDLVGVEVGVDVGAHAEALLTYCPVAMLHLVDPWPDVYARGFCDGRLSRFRSRRTVHAMGSLDAAKQFFAQSCRLGDGCGTGNMFDFVYIDQVRDGASVTADLNAWWPLLKPGGILGYRNYAQGRGDPLDCAIDGFVAANKIRTKVERYLNDVVLFR